MSFFKDFLTAVALAALSFVSFGAGGFTYGFVLKTFAYRAAIILGVQSYASNRARKAAKNAGRTSQNNVTLRSVDYPECILYGRARVPTILAYACTHTAGDGITNLMTMVLALPLRHEIDAIEKILFNDYDILLADGQVDVSAGRYYKTVDRTHSYQTPGVAASATVTLPHSGASLVVANSVDTIVWTSTTDIITAPGDVMQYATVELIGGTDYTQSGNVLTMLRDLTGGTLGITYRYRDGTAYVRVIRNLAGSTPHDWGSLGTDSGGEWDTVSDKLDGVPNVVIRYVWDYENTLWAGGMPDVTVIARGKKLYDPQTATTAWSDVPALAWRDYMKYEFECVDAELDDTSVVAAKGVCNVDVAIDGVGGTEKAFTINGLISTGDDYASNIEKIAMTMMGNSVCTGGKWRIVPFAWSAPVSTLTTDSLTDGDVEIDSRPGVEDIINAVRGQFVDTRPTQFSSAGLYVLNDFPPYESSGYINQDLGKTYYADLDLPLTVGHLRAQRMAKAYMFLARNALTVKAPFNPDAYELQPGDRVRLPWTMNGWQGTYEGGAGKVFIVMEGEYEPPHRVPLALKEDASAYYSWTYTEGIGLDPSPNSTLPMLNVVLPLSGVRVRSDATTFYVDQIGSVVPYVEISFDRPVQQDVYVVCFWKRAAESVFREIRCAVGATYVWIENIGPSEILNAYLIVYNRLGAQSDPTWIPRIVTGTDVPAPVIAVSANLLRNTNFDGGVVTGWIPYKVGGTVTPTLQRHTDVNYRVNGSPSSVYLDLQDASTGTARVAGMYTETLIPIDTALTYLAFCGLIPYGCDARIFIQWFSVQQNYLAGYDVISTPVPNSGANPFGTWSDPTNYRVNSVRGVAPTGAAYARMVIQMSGDWAAVPTKFLSLLKPFFGVIPAGALGLPPWDPGGNNPVETPSIARDAATEVFRQTWGRTAFGSGNTANRFIMLAQTPIAAASDGWMEVTWTIKMRGTGASDAPTSYYATHKDFTVSPDNVIDPKTGVASRDKQFALFTVPTNTAAEYGGAHAANPFPVLAGQSIVLRLDFSSVWHSAATGSSIVAKQTTPSGWANADYVDSVEFKAVLIKR